MQTQTSVTNIQELEALIQRVNAAQEKYAHYTQDQVDQIFKKAALAANAARIPLAKMAVEETGMGIIEDKVIKNHFASEIIYNKYKQEKTCGVIEEDQSFGFQKIAEPVGILAGIVPTTNPTSTAVFKALLALKTRNGIIFSPHPRAKKATAEAAKIILKAAVEAGAPDDIIGWIDEPTVPLSQALMQHPDIKLILATGGPGMVKAAYSSGHPSLGVGAGNTPAVIDETAHIKMAVSSILLSKTFDNGMICASEQSVIVVDEVYEEVRQEFCDRGAYFLNDEEKEKVRHKIIVDGRLNAEIVGQSVEKLAQLAEISIPATTRVLIGEVTEISRSEPFAYEKLSPILAMYRAATFEEAVDKAEMLIKFGGMGHTAVLYTAPSNKEHIKYYESKVETARVLINTPSSQGAIGDLYNFRLDPSLTLGCGTWGGNSISGNVGPQHLLNVKTVTERRENMLWFRIPPKVYFKYGCLSTALRELAGKQRALIITDKPLYEMGVTRPVEEILEEIGLMYEHPETEFEGLAMRFMDIRKRVYELPTLGQKAIMVAIPTTSGTGSEVTPFAVVTDERTGIKYPLADYALTPNMAIVDPELVMNMPKRLTAYGGIDALTHALEAYVSVYASEFTNGLALEAIRLLFKYLPSAYKNGAKDAKAREKVHYAATMAGMAFANGFLGVCHSMAHKLGSTFHVPHGLANALLISHVIRYNATDVPFKQAIFPQYKYPNAKWRYARIADYLELGGNTEEEKVEKLVEAVENLKREIDIPMTIKEVLSDKDKAFYEEVEEMAEQAFDDQCTGANPRYPLIRDLKELYILAYRGCPVGAGLYHPEVNPSNGTVVTATGGDVEEPTAATV